MSDPCETCGGEGEVEEPYYLGHGRIGYRYHDCPDCDGEPDRARLEERLEARMEGSDGRVA